MDNQQARRERIAAQVLGGLAACGSDCTLASEVQLAVNIADALIAELDRTAPSNPPVVPEGWVIWDDSDSERPVRCMNVWHKLRVESWHGLPVRPFSSEEMARLHLDKFDATRKLRVRKWPLDPAEDKEVQS